MKKISESQLYSVCQQCNTNCGIKVHIQEGQVTKIEGNPFSPWTKTPHLPYDTPLDHANTQTGALCPKGYAGMQTLYDPYRLTKVLKRVGKRGERQWKSMDFHEAIKEIVHGGNLFGEGHVDGLKDIATLRDASLMNELAKDAQAVAKKELSLQDFKKKHAAHLHHLIDPNHPDLGPKNNQICYNWGRQKGGRSEFIQRFFRDNLGTTNTHGHTTICQGSLYFTCKAISDQFTEGTFSGGQKFYWQADTQHANFILFVGANPMEANYGPPLRASKLSEQKAHGSQRIAVADPRLSKTAAKAWKWLPVEPHGVGALGMALLQWIIHHEAYDARYLANCTQGAAQQDKEPTWTQAAWLVKIHDDGSPHGSPGAFLRASDLGYAPEERPSTREANKTWLFDAFVTLHNGKTRFFDPNSLTEIVHGDLFVDTQLHGQRVKSVLQLYKEAATEKTFQQWAEQAGIDETEIEAVAKEFTSHGKKAVADIHRGVSQHTNGFYNVAIWMMVNTLMGNCDWKGGLSKATTYDTSGTKAQGPFDISHGKKLRPWGISIIRHGVHYEQSTLFKGYPAPRVWYPFASDIYQEIIPSAGQAYPYKLKALFLYMASPAYSLPAGNEIIRILADPKHIPLIVASDISVGETSMYADYIFPDVTYLERWEFSGSHPSQVCKVAPIRQPVVAPLTDTVTVFGQNMPIHWESTLLAFAECMQLPGFGAHAFGQNQSLQREEDIYLRMVANIAHGEKVDGSQKVPAASAKEMALFEHSRRHLPSTIYDNTRWKNIVGEALWPHVVTVLNRGGRFQALHEAYDGEYLSNKYAKMLNIYFENLALATHPMTGKAYTPYAKVMPSPVDCLGRPLPDKAAGYDLTLITYKAISQCKSRTAASTWLRTVHPENYIEMAAQDAARLGIQDGDTAKITSASNPDGLWYLNHKEHKVMQGKVKVLQGLRPGVVAFSLGYGHWAHGAASLCIDGIHIKDDTGRARGIHANAAMRVDPVLKNTSLADTVGGSVVFYQTPIQVCKVSE